MGKDKRKQRKTNNSLQKKQVDVPEGFNAKEVLYGLDSTSTETRINSSGVIAALFGDADTDMMKNMDAEEQRSKTNIKYAIQAQIPKRLITHLCDSSEPVVMNCLGALRNMCISGEDEILKLLIQQDVLTPLHSLFLTYIPKLSQSLVSVYVPQLLIQAFSLLSLFFDYDLGSITLFGMDTKMFESFYICVKNNNNELQKASCECLDIITDAVPLPVSILQDLSIYIPTTQGYAKSRLLAMYFESHPPNSDEELKPFINEIQSGLSIRLFNEINIIKDIFIHINEDAINKEKTMSEIMGLKMDLDVNEMMGDEDEHDNNTNNNDNNNDTMMKSSSTAEEAEMRKMEKQKEKVYKNAINHYINTLTVISGYLDLLKTLLKMNNEEETLRYIPVNYIQGLFPCLLSLIQSNTNLFSLSPYLISPTLDVYISIYECLDVMNIYVNNFDVASINSLWSSYITPCVPMDSSISLISSKHIFKSITKCIWSYLEAIHRYKQDHQNILEPISLTPILDVQVLSHLISIYPETSTIIFNIIALYITLYQPHADHIPYIQLIISKVQPINIQHKENLEIYSVVLDSLMTIFSDTPSIPCYIQLQIHPLFKQLLKSVSIMLSSFLGDYDEDIVNYAAATVENGESFIQYIQEEMKNI